MRLRREKWKILHQEQKQNEELSTLGALRLLQPNLLLREEMCCQRLEMQPAKTKPC